MASIDGICEECGKTGFVGEVCSFCGNKIEALDKDLERFESDATMPVVRDQVPTPHTGDDPDFDDDVADFSEDDDHVHGDVSMEDLADKENDSEDKEAWFDPENFNSDEEEA